MKYSSLGCCVGREARREAEYNIFATHISERKLWIFWSVINLLGLLCFLRKDLQSFAKGGYLNFVAIWWLLTVNWESFWSRRDWKCFISVLCLPWCCSEDVPHCLALCSSFTQFLFLALRQDVLHIWPTVATYHPGCGPPVPSVWQHTIHTLGGPCFHWCTVFKYALVCLSPLAFHCGWQPSLCLWLTPPWKCRNELNRLTSDPADSAREMLLIAEGRGWIRLWHSQWLMMLQLCSSLIHTRCEGNLVYLRSDLGKVPSLILYP